MKFLFAILFFVSSSTCFSQSDSVVKKTIWLRPSFENGVSFLRNDYLKNAFETNSTYNWGVGIRFGNALSSDLLPFIQYSNSKHTRRETGPSNQLADSVLRINEIIGGFVFPVKRFDASMLRAKAGFIRSTILDEVSKNEGNGNGVQLGLGFETRLEGRSRVYIDCSYNLIKFDLASFRDYDLLKLSIGVVL